MNHKRRPDELLDELYRSVPPGNCTGECARLACGSIGMAPVERDRIIRRHGVRLPLAAAFGPDSCPALTGDDRCSVYANRPLICRTYGQVPSMPCPFGCTPADQMLDERTGVLAVARTFELSGDRVTAAKYRRAADLVAPDTAAR